MMKKWDRELYNRGFRNSLEAIGAWIFMTCCTAAVLLFLYLAGFAVWGIMEYIVFPVAYTHDGWVAIGILVLSAIIAFCLMPIFWSNE